MASSNVAEHERTSANRTEPPPASAAPVRSSRTSKEPPRNEAAGPEEEERRDAPAAEFQPGTSSHATHGRNGSSFADAPGVVVDVSGPEVGFEVGFSETHLAATRARRGFAAAAAERLARLGAASSAEPPPQTSSPPPPSAFAPFVPVTFLVGVGLRPPPTPPLGSRELFSRSPSLPLERGPGLGEFFPQRAVPRELRAGEGERALRRGVRGALGVERADGVVGDAAVSPELRRVPRDEAGEARAGGGRQPSGVEGVSARRSAEVRAKRASEAAAGDDAAGAATATGPGPAAPKDGGEEDGGAAGTKEPEAERWRAEEPAAEPSRGASDASKSLVAEPSLVAAAEP